MAYLKIAGKILLALIAGIAVLILFQNPALLGGLFGRLLGGNTSGREDELKSQIQKDKQRIKDLKEKRKADQRQNAGVEQAIENVQDQLAKKKERLKQVKNQQYNDILSEWNRRNS